MSGIIGNKPGQSGIPRCDSVTQIYTHKYHIGYADRASYTLEDDEGKTSTHSSSLRRTRPTFDSKILLYGFGSTGQQTIV